MKRNIQTKAYTVHIYTFHISERLYDDPHSIKSRRKIDIDIEDYLEVMMNINAKTYSWEYAKGTSKLHWNKLAPEIYIMNVPGEWFYIITTKFMEDKAIIELLKNEKKYSPKA